MTKPIDPAEIARILRDDRATHRLQRPDDGTWAPSPWELRITLAIVVAVIFACFAVAS